MEALARTWWTLVWRGIAAIVFGGLVLLLPLWSASSIARLFGVYTFIDGLLAFISSLRALSIRAPWDTLVLEGVTGMGIGALAWSNRELLPLVMLVLVAAWAVITGVLKLIAAGRLRREIPEEGLLALAGGLSVVLGLVMLIWTRHAALQITWVLGAYAIAFGVTLLTLGQRLRRIRHEMEN